MLWPSRAVESSPGRFAPPHCPWAECPGHLLPGSTVRFHRHGSFRTRCSSNPVPRFRCLDCRRTFSRQTFTCSYYLKHPRLPACVAAGLQAGSAHRQIARTLGCAPSTVTRLSARLGRHALLLLAQTLENVDSIGEPIAVDHFETFEFSQDFPVGLATAVGRDSWFVYGIDPAPHGRAGRVSPAQKQRLKGRPTRESHGGYTSSFGRVLDLLARRAPRTRPLRLLTDGHPAYRQAHARHRWKQRVQLHEFPNPKRGPKGSARSREAIDRDRALFAVDVLHGLLRHSAAHHRRETIAFGRRVNAVVERMFLTAIWRNFVKGRSERRPDPNTPAMGLGLTREPWSWPRVFAKRLFPWKVRVPEGWMRVYRREWTTPVVGRNDRHELKNAY